MAVLAWSMMGLALWHFTVFLPDRFWGGIVGCFVFAVFGAVVFGFLINGAAVPGRADTHLLTALEAVPGAVLAMGVCYYEGVRRERSAV